MRHSCPSCAAWLLAAVFLSACHSSSPLSPSAVPAGAAANQPGGVSTASGRAVDIFSGTPLPSVTLTLDDGPSAVTGADGTFVLSAQETGLCRVAVSGAGHVTRETSLPMPVSGASLSLIPADFDLATFDEMYRGDGTLHRWPAAPSLVIIDAVLEFTSVSDSAFTALADRLTAADRAAIEADLAWGLSQATGNSISSFASVTVESPAAGTSVNFFSREGSIVVARFKGLSQRTGYWGYGRWGSRGDVVGAGAIMLDRDFDAAGTQYGRSLRVHELGHALGYSHVTGRQSFMNQSATVEPTDFDRNAARVAFARPPGNQSPDRDPAASAVGTRAAGPLTWSAPQR